MSITFKIYARQDDYLKMMINQICMAESIDPVYITGYNQLFPGEAGELALLYQIHFRKTLDKTLVIKFARALNNHQIIEYAHVD